MLLLNTFRHALGTFALSLRFQTGPLKLLLCCVISSLLTSCWCKSRLPRDSIFCNLIVLDAVHPLRYFHSNGKTDLYSHGVLSGLNLHYTEHTGLLLPPCEQWLAARQRAASVCVCVCLCVWSNCSARLHKHVKLENT